MTVMTDLAKRMRVLPDKRELKKVVVLLANYFDKLEVSRKRFVEVCRQLQAIERIAPDIKLAKAHEGRRAAVSKARKLRKELAQASGTDAIIVSVERKATEHAVTAIGEGTLSASTKIREIWEAYLTQYVRPFDELSQTASRLGLKGADELLRALQDIKARLKSPPQDATDADTIKALMDTVRQAVDGLGMKGKAGEFLKKAVAGQADPLDLFDNEVKQFFDDRQLWGLLRVSVK